MLDSMYEPDERDRSAFGDAYKPPARFDYGAEVLVATYPAEGDGHTVKVYESRYPARFFRINADERTNWDGSVTPAFSLSTGSGQEELVAAIAKAIQAGMLSLTNDKENNIGN